jgi:hypothetical protein
MKIRVTQTEPMSEGNDQPALPPALARELLEALRSIRYGAIELVIHDGRVVQLERREKVRFDPELTLRNGNHPNRGRPNCRPPKRTDRTAGGRHLKLRGEPA